MSGTARQVGKSQLEGEIHREINWASGMHRSRIICVACIFAYVLLEVYSKGGPAHSFFNTID